MRKDPAVLPQIYILNLPPSLAQRDLLPFTGVTVYPGKGNARPWRTAGHGIRTDTDSRRPSASRLRQPVRPGAWGWGSLWCQLSVCPSFSRHFQGTATFPLLAPTFSGAGSPREAGLPSWMTPLYVRIPPLPPSRLQALRPAPSTKPPSRRPPAPSFSPCTYTGLCTWNSFPLLCLDLCGACF